MLFKVIFCVVEFLLTIAYFFIEPLILFTPNKWQIDAKFIHLIFLANINAYREVSMEIWCEFVPIDIENRCK